MFFPNLSNITWYQWYNHRLSTRIMVTLLTIIDSMFYNPLFSRFVAYYGKRKNRVHNGVDRFTVYAVQRMSMGVIFFKGLWNNDPCDNFAMNPTATRCHLYEPLAASTTRLSVREWSAAQTLETEAVQHWYANVRDACVAIPAKLVSTGYHKWPKPYFG